MYNRSDIVKLTLLTPDERQLEAQVRWDDSGGWLAKARTYPFGVRPLRADRGQANTATSIQEVQGGDLAYPH